MPTISDKNTVKAVAKAFVNNGRNKEEALVSVGYKKSYARSQGKQLWERPTVIEAILREERRLAALIDVSTSEVIKELRRYAFKDDADAITEANTGDRLRALELLGKHKAMFKDVVQDGRDRAPRPESDEQVIQASEARRRLFKLSNNNKTEPSN